MARATKHKQQERRREHAIAEDRKPKPGAKARGANSGSGASPASKSGSTAARSASTRSAAARKGGKARGRQQRAQKGAAHAAKAATKPAPRRADVSAKTVAELREALRQNLIRPLDMMLITRERIEQVLGEAVERGQVTVDGAQGIASRGSSSAVASRPTTCSRTSSSCSTAAAARSTTAPRDVRRAATDAARDARKQVSGARSAPPARPRPALAQADRLRRAAGVGPSFPITASTTSPRPRSRARLTDLAPAELRKVRDYERRNANRKTVLNAIESKLG